MLEVAIAGRPLVLGLVADRVIEVMALSAGEIEPAPEIGVRWRSDYILGVGHRDGRFVIIFNLARLFSEEDTAALLVLRRGVMKQASATKPAVPAQGRRLAGRDRMPVRGWRVFDYLSPANFEFLAEFIESYTGIKMPPSKKTMVECRLRRRAQAVGMRSLQEYCAYLFEQGGLDTEAVNLIDAVTTNKTDFFREPKHFDFLVEQAIPALIAQGALCALPAQGLERRQLDWRRAVYAGHGPGGAEGHGPGLFHPGDGHQHPGAENWNAGDLSRRSWRTPYPRRSGNATCSAGKQGARDRVRIVPELRRTVRFQRLNLMETPYSVDRDMHVVFCRNILIYFDKQTQQNVLKQICSTSGRAVICFWGIRKSVAGFALPLTQVAASVFRAEDVIMGLSCPRSDRRRLGLGPPDPGQHFGAPIRTSR